MRIKIASANLHTPLFMGHNIGLSVDKAKKTGLNVEYDTILEAMVVVFNGKTALVPSSNIASMVMENPSDLDRFIDNSSHPETKKTTKKTLSI